MIGSRRIARASRLLPLAAAWALALGAGAAMAQNAAQGCDTQLPTGFTEAEQSAWNRICLYGYADMSQGDDKGCEATSDAEWPASRTLSQSFLDTILFDEPYVGLRKSGSIQIRCAVYPEQINFRYRELGPALLLDDSRMMAGISLFNARAQRLLSFRGDKIEGGIDADRLQIQDNFFTRQGTQMTGELTLTGARMGGNVEAGGSQYGGGVDLDGATVEGTVFVNNGAVLNGELRLVAAHVGRTVDVGGATINGPLNADSSRIGGGVFFHNNGVYNDQVVLRAARVGGDVEVSNSTFNGEFTVDRAHIDGSLFARNTKFYGKAVLSSVQIGANIEFGGAEFNGQFDSESITVDKAMFLTDGVRFRGPVYLRYSSIGGSISADGASFEGGVFATGLRVGRSIQLEDGARVEGGLKLDSAKIADSIYLSRSSFGGGLSLERAVVDGSVFASNAQFGGALDMSGAQIGGNVELFGSTLDGVLNAELMKLDKALVMSSGAVFRAPVYLRYSEIGGNLVAAGGRFEQGLFATGVRVGRSVQFDGEAVINQGLSLDSARIADSLFLSSAQLDGRIDLKGANIGNELALSDPNRGDPVFGAESFMVLRNTSVGSLRARPEAWRRGDGADLPLDLVGFSYERESALDSREMASMLSAPADQLIQWIESQRGPAGADHDADYNPQPYEQLQAALISAGRFEKARAIKFAQFEHYRRARSTPDLRRQGMLVLKYLAGYGVYPVMAVFWFVGIVCVGALIGHFSPGLAGRSSSEKFWYSFDNALPLVELSEYNKRVVHERDWISSFFHGQRIFGLVLATALIGAVSLL